LRKLLVRSATELKAFGGDIVLVAEPGVVEEALRLVGDGLVRLGVDAIGGAKPRTTPPSSFFHP